MKLTLMMKNYPVLDFNLKNNNITNIGKIYYENRIPIGIINNLTEENLQTWIEKRCVPNKRPLYKNLMAEFKKNIWEGILLTHGLNLSDQYWIRNENENLDWNHINFYNNPFSFDMGNLLFGREMIHSHPDFYSPDFCTNGITPKSWRIKDEKRHLIKGNFYGKNQECINEVIVSKFLSYYSDYIKCQNVKLTKIDDRIFSCATIFTSDNIELVPALSIAQYQQKPKNVFMYDHLIRMCRLLEIPNVEPFMSYMITVDALLNQKDRHLGNFGFLRDAETLRFIGPAPLYDNGDCLWYDEELGNCGPGLFDQITKPFAPTFAEQIKYIKNFDLSDNIDLDQLFFLIDKTMDKAEFDRSQKEIVKKKLKNRAFEFDRSLSILKIKQIEKEHNQERILCIR